MPIPGLRDQQTLSFPKIGDIRKGAPKLENGQMGPDLTYFRYVPIKGEELAEATFHEVYEDEPRAINVLLPFAEVSRNFEAYMERHTASALQCRGDIEGGKCYMWRDKSGEMQHTPKDCPTPICKGCKETGRLKIIIPELQRLGYITVHTTSIWDIIELTRNLGALCKLTGNGLQGIPLVLKRRPRMVSTPRKGGKRVRQETWLLSIEADQRWVKEQLTAMERAALPSTHVATLSPPDLPAPSQAGLPERVRSQSGLPASARALAGGPACLPAQAGAGRQAGVEEMSEGMLVDKETGEVLNAKASNHAEEQPAAEEPGPKTEGPELEAENGPDFPIAWRAYADKAVKELHHYQDMYQVIKVLKQAGISPVSDAEGNCMFNLADAWTILMSEADHSDE